MSSSDDMKCIHQMKGLQYSTINDTRRNYGSDNKMHVLTFHESIHIALNKQKTK